MAERFLFTSESVTEGHPDKMCDQISDGVLDAIMEEDPEGRVACEALTTTGVVLVAGEITTSTYVDIPKLVRQIVREIGYTKGAYGLDYETCSVITSINEQSPDIAQGVSKKEPTQLGAGDQGLMFGYACDDTPEYMPIPIQLAHRLARRVAETRKHNIVPHLRPDGKTQVTVDFKDGKAKHAHAIIIAAQHDEDISVEDLRKRLISYVVEPVIEEYVKSGHLPEDFFTPQTQLFINNTGRFVRGGPFADTGLTGRKIIVDTYGGWAPHGGGAFSGKDPTKVDRSASYGARWAAKNVVAAGIAKKCLIQLAYCIGHHEPVSIHVDTFGSGKLKNEQVASIVKKVFDFSPGALIRDLQLRRPLYRPVAAYGHFGRDDLSLPWEELDRVGELKRLAKVK